MSILVASLIAPPFLDDQRRWGSWLSNSDKIKESVPDTDVNYYCAVELDGRGLSPYDESGWVEATSRAGVNYETFTYGSGRIRIETDSRIKHICLGRNIISQVGIMDPSVSHILALDGDVTPPPNILPNLLAVNYPLVSACIPTYCFSAPRIDVNPRDGSQEYPKRWNVQPTRQSSAGAWLIERSVFTALRWRSDPVHNLSDDPAYLYDMVHVLGIDPPVLQRGDTIARHWPESIGPIDSRLPDTNLTPLNLWA